VPASQAAAGATRRVLHYRGAFEEDGPAAGASGARDIPNDLAALLRWQSASVGSITSDVRGISDVMVDVSEPARATNVGGREGLQGILA